MPLTIDEILAHEESLQREIAQKQALLAAYRLLRAHTTEALLAKPEPLQLVESTAPTAPADPPSPPPVKSYMHPELEAFTGRFRNHGKIVWWAIQRMTDDYSLRDIDALLRREGYPLSSAEISVVLTRLKSRGEIEEVKRGRGRIAAVFRKPESTTPLEIKYADQTVETPTTTESTVAA